MDYNATITLGNSKLTEEFSDKLIGALCDYHPAVGVGRAGRAEVIPTYPADSPRQATSTAWALAESVDLDVSGIEVLPTSLWDQRADSVEIPRLVSVAEAAEILGISRQAVAQRLDAGSLIGTRVGKVWVIPRAHL